MLESIKNIVYIKQLMPSMNEEYFELEICENRNILKYGSMKNKKHLNISNEQVIHYIDQLFRIIDGWESEYIETRIIDGIAWELQVTYLDGNKECYKGRNDFPNNFEYLDKIKNELVLEKV